MSLRFASDAMYNERKDGTAKMSLIEASKAQKNALFPKR